MFNLKRVPSPLEISKDFIRYNWVQPLFKQSFLPRAMCFYVTYRCNMRCKMCGIWKQNRLDPGMSLKELSRILSDLLFSKLEYININGGEPNLRDDLSEIVELFIDKFPNLKTITINSNGLPFKRAVSNIERISHICKENNIRFSVSISLHKIGKEYDKIAGIENAYIKVKKTLKALKEIQNKNRFYLAINCVITNLNLFSVGEMSKWSKKEQIPVNFTLGEIRERFNNLDMKDDIEIKDEKKDFLIKFFRTLAKEKSIFTHHVFRYKVLADMIELKKKRNISCHYAIGGVILGPYGKLYYCPHSKAIGNCRNNFAYDIYYSKRNLEYRKKKLLNEECKKCPPYTFNRIELEKDILKYLTFLIKKQKN